MKRDWSQVNQMYEHLLTSVYPQPPDAGHTLLASQVIVWAMGQIRNLSPYKTFLDLGAGQGFLQEIVEGYGFDYLGVALGKDVWEAQKAGKNVVEMDFNFLDLPYMADIGLSRHSLEHSPFPIITLCHWKDYIKDYLIVVLPHPDWYRYRGQNHFSVAEEAQAENWFEQSGWEIVASFILKTNGRPDRVAPEAKTNMEMWYLLKKKVTV